MVMDVVVKKKRGHKPKPKPPCWRKPKQRQEEKRSQGTRRRKVSNIAPGS